MNRLSTSHSLSFVMEEGVIGGVGDRKFEMFRIEVFEVIDVLREVSEASEGGLLHETLLGYVPGLFLSLWLGGG